MEYRRRRRGGHVPDGSGLAESRANGRRGLGHGLFIVREIVRAHAGTIDVCSCDDLTAFAVTLPRTAPPANDPVITIPTSASR
jgi:signal transduction histidine kinase